MWSSFLVQSQPLQTIHQTTKPIQRKSLCCEHFLHNSTKKDTGDCDGESQNDSGYSTLVQSYALVRGLVNVADKYLNSSYA